MPCDYRKNYPSNWKSVSADIRANRAQHVCECTGQCGTDHEKEWDAEIAEIFSYVNLAFPSNRCQAMNKCEHPITNSRVVLTVAHLCQCTPLCSDPAHLKAMCQRCHLRLDAELHTKSAARTRRQKRNNQELFDV